MNDPGASDHHDNDSQDHQNHQVIQAEITTSQSTNANDDDELRSSPSTSTTISQQMLAEVSEKRMLHASELENIEKQYLRQRAGSSDIILHNSPKPIHQTVSFDDLPAVTTTVQHSVDQFPVHQISNNNHSSSGNNMSKSSRVNEREQLANTVHKSHPVRQCVSNAWMESRCEEGVEDRNDVVVHREDMLNSAEEDENGGGDGDEFEDGGKEDYDIFDPSRVIYESEEEIDHQAWIDNISDSMTSISEYDLYNRGNPGDPLMDNRKRDITIPVPFSFTDREQTKAKSIRRKRFEEYLRSLKEEHEYYRKNTFKANPVPLSTIEPRYEQLQVRRSLNKKHLKTTARELAKSLQKPFNFAERDARIAREKELAPKPKEEKVEPFRANPVPKSSKELKFDRMQRVEERMRRRRVEMRARDLLYRSSLPPRMAMHEAVAASKGDDTGFLKGPRQFSFQPKINTSVPDFARLQNEFYMELAMKKQSRPLTEVKEFSFHKSTRSHNSSRLDRSAEMEYMNDYDRGYRVTKPPASFYRTPKVKAEPTKAQKLRDETIRRALEERERKRQEKQREDEEREAKMKKNTVVVARNLPKARTMEEEMEARRREKEDGILEMKRAAAQRNQELGRKMKDRPFLFETEIVDTARERVMSSVRQTLKETGTDYLMESLEAVRGINDSNVSNHSNSNSNSHHQLDTSITGFKPHRSLRQST